MTFNKQQLDGGAGMEAEGYLCAHIAWPCHRKGWPRMRPPRALPKRFVKCHVIPYRDLIIMYKLFLVAQAHYPHHVIRKLASTGIAGRSSSREYRWVNPESWVRRLVGMKLVGLGTSLTASDGPRDSVQIQFSE